MTTKQERARAAYWRERKEWESRRAAALAATDGARDIESMMPLARAYWLAKADEEEYTTRGSVWVRVFRVRANSESYLGVWCLHRLTERLKKSADDATGLSLAERKAIEDQHMAETNALIGALNAMIRTKYPVRG